MNFIKLKIFVGFLVIHLIDQICCETYTLEDKYETGREILLSITIYHENITSIFAKVNKEYDDLTNKFKDLNNKSINDFIELSKKQIVMEVNNLAKTLNKYSIDEQSKFEDLVRKNTNTFQEIMPSFNNCLKKYNSLKKTLRCIDQHQNTKNATGNEFYQNFKNLLDTYNSILIPNIKDIEKKFISATNEIIIIANKNNEELIKKKSSIATPSPAQSKKDNLNMNHLFSKTSINNTLKNLYIDQKNMFNTANLVNWIAIQSMSLNMTLNHIQKMNRVDHHEGKNSKCCFDYSQFRLDKAKIIAVNDINNCVEIGRLDLQDFVSLQIKEAEKNFTPCFYKDARPEDIFVCMGWHQSTRNAPSILKTAYKEAVNKFTKNQQILSGDIFNCSYKRINYFDERLKHLTSQIDICIHNQKPYEKCIEPTRN